ncbi:dTDP-4-dehydrorhamnose reductase [Micromonospora pisi]|uniref:dTDP-4-dehydrorhamnose reductase n=1 Tax=Micromonospora pisi TaxID=589240 RepID=A0A495JRR7_9ACTN|nr:sugar nucleotide-binding protein [Micromonospora pisi]RKR91653.1 dTDP-4-dehydrorhamnose reductase [Micromonospora pisi]
MILLVVGASGHLGGEVCRRAVTAGTRVVGTYHRAPAEVDGVDWQPLDARDPAAVDALVRRTRPDAVVNTAYVYGDWALCADGAGYLARSAVAVGARLVHLSSDALHAGRPQPYGDDEAPTPVYPYGAAKAAAETAVRLIAPAAALVRTSLIVGDERSRQIQLCLDALDPNSGVRLFSDEIRCPVDVTDLASAVLELVDSDHAGLLNVAGPDPVSRADLGRLVARRYGLDPDRLTETTIASTGLTRPAQVRLDSSRAAGLLKTRLRGVRELFTA